MKDLTIIVPVYNVEKYIATCLQSILKTNWQEISYEIVVVDDESPDQSMKIVSEIAAAHPQIKTVSQKNKGLGGARNTGIALAEGQYIFFLDSDDYLVNDQLPVMVRKAEEQNADIFEFNAITVKEDYREIKQLFKVQENTSTKGIEYFSNFHPADSVCNKLYRKSFLLRKAITFLEGVYVEDAPFNVEAFLKAESVASDTAVPVAFLQNQSSITRSKRSGGYMKKFISDSIKVIGRMADLSAGNSDDAFTLAIKRKLAFFVSGTLLMVLKSEQPFRQKLQDVQRLKSLNVYPMKYKSGSVIRDFFLLVVNRRFALFLGHVFFSLKTIAFGK